MTLLVALAGPSRSGKGTSAAVFTQRCLDLGPTCLERQLSDNGKWSLARIFKPKIGRVEAVAWFEELKNRTTAVHLVDEALHEEAWGYEHLVEVPLQKFLQHGLQEGGRDIFGEDLWTDRIIAGGVRMSDGGINWLDTFFDDEAGIEPTDVALISDLRQPSEAMRVKDLGGLVVECVRPTVVDAYRTGVDHVTELRLPPELVDMQIVNSDGVDELRAAARELFDVRILPYLKQGASSCSTKVFGRPRGGLMT